jgi:hypothetical protein
MTGSAARGDFPSNPMDKPGYLLEFHDEFPGPAVDEGKWLPFHLPQWSSRAQAAANTGFENGHLVLKIDADQPPWCPEYDGGVRVSSLQTGLFAGPLGSTLGQHRFHPGSVVREAQPQRITYAPLHGYFELLAKGVRTPGNHAALWMIGYEDSPERSSEICICELFGQDAGATASTVRFGVHPFADPEIADDFRAVRLPIDAGDFHIYAAEWTPERIHFYVDNQEVGVVEQSPRYPMQFMLGLYERPQDTRSGADAYPKRFVVDYFRAYRPIGGYRAGA